MEVSEIPKAKPDILLRLSWEEASDLQRFLRLKVAPSQRDTLPMLVDVLTGALKVAEVYPEQETRVSDR